ncbi:hypothetical protein AXX17_AT1G11110 [Arabidopsis thaliana]|uniref:Uncharacterized protein n=1 Tax=Arabidopsis thaliana TaxID=3702 RepID=A0A178WMG2_ARATH|nr:hypothetical protein AXX17_AT1G11110 [Arabidopsis thaliana]
MLRSFPFSLLPIPMVNFVKKFLFCHHNTSKPSPRLFLCFGHIYISKSIMIHVMNKR